MATSAHLVRPAARAGARDEGFEAFFRASYAQLVRALTPVAGDVNAAEDLVQEAMARAYHRWDRVAVMDSSTGYVYATAVNLHRRHQRRLSRLLRMSIPRPAPAAPDPADAVAARQDVLAAVAGLPDGQRDALLMVEWLGIDAASAGRILGIEPSSVRARIHRARAALRPQLER